MDDEKFCDMCLKEMFKRVGEKYPNKKFTDQPEWYTKKTWTEKEQESFKKWLVGKMEKRWRYLRKERIEAEASLFILMWGWKTDGKSKRERR